MAGGEFIGCWWQVACAAVGHVKFKETLAKSAHYVDVSGIFWRTEGVLVCTPLLPCGTIYMEDLEICDGNLVTRTFLARRRLVLCLNDEAARRAYVCTLLTLSLMSHPENGYTIYL